MVGIRPGARVHSAGWPVLKMLTGLLLAMTVTATACSSGDDDDAAEAAGSSTTSRPPTTSFSMPMPSWCTPASHQDVQAIESSMSGHGYRLIDAFSAMGDNGYRYVMANVNDAGGSRITSVDMWAFDPAGRLHALSNVADRYSTLPYDGNLATQVIEMPNVMRITDCIEASEWEHDFG
jgi:hypothetical protein